METVRTETINGRKTTFVRYTEEEIAAVRAKLEEIRNKAKGHEEVP